MKVIVKSHKAALRHLQCHPRIATILIRDPDETCREEPKEPKLVKGAVAGPLLELFFHDVEFNKKMSWSQQTAPTQAEIATAIKFARHHEEVLVTCTAGVGRSAALGYVLRCIHEAPAEAIKLLDPKVHCPNMAVVRHGQSVLAKRNVVLECENFMVAMRAISYSDDEILDTI